ncbi:universal stress protein [Alcaligenes sp. WGS1538]|uniref:universal stress protein n=1 Tax=Alcaligenes sp. WGS1538 TaxID=3366811 RepID=UPI00372D4B2C
MYERILVATDGSELSDHAVRHALNLAKACDAKLIALRVIPRYRQSYLEGGPILDQKMDSRVEALWTEHAQAELAAVKQAGKDIGVAVKAVVAKSDLIANAIISAAEKQKADLIVMASHGRKGYQRILLGSETQHVLTQSEIPVLVIRKKAKKK